MHFTHCLFTRYILFYILKNLLKIPLRHEIFHHQSGWNKKKITSFSNLIYLKLKYLQGEKISLCYLNYIIKLELYRYSIQISIYSLNVYQDSLSKSIHIIYLNLFFNNLSVPTIHLPILIETCLYIMYVRNVFPFPFFRVVMREYFINFNRISITLHLYIIFFGVR